MKTKSLIFIALTIFFCTFANAQVRQIFKVTDYGTGKPLAGATFDCCGQTLTTNANGVAVFSSKKHKYGNFVKIDAIKLPGYTFVGRDWKTGKNDTFRKDTLVYYMVDEQRYIREAETLFDSLFLFNYRNKTAPALLEAATMANYGFYPADELAGNLMSANPFTSVVEMRHKAECINPLLMPEYDKELRKDCETLLLSGDLQGCLEKARQQIVENDNSDKNLQRIAYYLDIKKETKDTLPTSELYKTLYNNNIRNRYHTTRYYRSLLAEGKENDAEQLRQSTLAKNIDPYLDIALIPNEFDGFDTNPQACIEKVGQTLKTAKQKTPDNHNFMSWLYAQTSTMHMLCGDTLKAATYLDSAFDELLQNIAENNPYPLSAKISALNDISNWPVDEIGGSTSEKINNYRLQLARDIYNSNRNALFGRMTYLYCMQKMMSDNNALASGFLPAIDSLSQTLADELPHIILPNMLLTKTYRLADAMQTQQTPGTMLKLLAEYRTVYDKCNNLYPNIFSKRSIATNSYLKRMAYRSDNDFLAEAIDAFNEELFLQMADRDDKDTLLARGEYYNHEAESMYHDELYRQSMQSYDKAAHYFALSAATDSSGYSHIRLCDNILQKGDAYYNLKRYNEATKCYQQVFDYEKQIPQPAMPRYTAQKGQTYHFQGDMMLAQKDYKKAMKLFKKSEKEFKKAEKMGDTTLYGYWAELHFSMAIAMIEQKKENKFVEELENAERLYQTKPMGNASRKYEMLKGTLLKYYTENKDWNKYLVCKSTFHQYLDSVKFTDIDHFNEYISSAVSLGGLWSNIGLPTATLRYYKEAKLGKEFLIRNDYAAPDDEYYDLAYNVARYYRICDSTPQAINQLIECEEISRLIYADTAPHTALFNSLNIKSQTALCYEDMAKTDTGGTDQWYQKALPLYTQIINTLSAMDTNPSLKRNLGQFHRRMASVHLNLNHFYTADKHFDTALAIMLPLCNAGYKPYVEDDVARNYLGKAIIYRSSDDYDNPTKAKQMLEACIETCQKSDNPDQMADIELFAVSMMIKLMDDNPQSGNDMGIGKYRKLQTELEKKLEKQR